LTQSEPKYNGGLTREQFLFYETRLVAGLRLSGLGDAEVVNRAVGENLFQFPTERMIRNIASVCLRRLDALGAPCLLEALASSPAEVARQVNLYAMMRQNAIVRDFMLGVIAQKYRTKDFSFTSRDVYVFLADLQQRQPDTAAWSEKTFAKIRQVLVKCLAETGFLDSYKSTALKSVYLFEELERGIRANNDTEALAAFNCLT